jgi:Dimethlysulfonioproprionate lyase
MGGSIAHPDPVGPLGALLTALAAAMDGAGAAAIDPSAAATLRDFSGLVRSIEPGSPRAVGPATRLPVCRLLEPALEAHAGPLVGALRALAPSLSWTQNPNYRRQPPDATFLDRYGYAVIAGPAAGPPALVLEPRLALGVLLLGPRAHYPLHAHPAVEVYYTLTPGEWWRDEGPWRAWGPGTAIHHPPNMPHATRAGAGPLLAIYLWRGDLATHASLTGTGR